MKIVFDTNVLLAAMFTRGVCEGLINHCVANQECRLFISRHILDEFSEHAAKFKATASEIQDAMTFLKTYFEVVEPVAVSPDACRDADDLPVLGTLVAAEADCLVTGDKDLLVLKAFQDLPIYSPRALFNLLVTPPTS